MSDAARSPTLDDEETGRVLAGVDAARRVGWAKFYDTDEQLRSAQARFAFAVGIALRVGKATSSIDQSLWLLDELLRDQLGDWPDDIGAIRLGRDAADAYVKLHWGSWQAVKADAVRFGDPQARRYEQPDRQVTVDSERWCCTRCDSLLARVTIPGRVELRCRKCKRINERDIK